MVIQRKLLIESLKQCLPGVETGNAVLEGADTFVFHDGKISTYNDLISVTVPIKQVDLVDENLTGCVKADEFFKIISKFPGDEIKFSVNENKWILKCSKAKAELTLIDFDYKSRLKNVSTDDEWIELNDDFIVGLKVCKMSVNKSQYAGVYVSNDDIVSTDSNQLNWFKMNTKNIPAFWISDNCVNELLKFKKLISVQLKNNWVHFKSDDDSVFSVKTMLVENYPYNSLGRILNSSDLNTAIVHGKFPKELFNAVDRAVSLSMNISEHSAIKLNIDKDRIEVSSERISGKYFEKVDWDEKIESDFEPVSIYVDVDMLQFVAQRTAEFYVLKGVNNIPRLFFVTDSSKHLLCTLNGNA